MVTIHRTYKLIGCTYNQSPIQVMDNSNNSLEQDRTVHDQKESQKADDADSCSSHQIEPAHVTPNTMALCHVSHSMNVWLYNFLTASGKDVPLSRIASSSGEVCRSANENTSDPFQPNHQYEETKKCSPFSIALRSFELKLDRFGDVVNFSNDSESGCCSTEMTLSDEQVWSDRNDNLSEDFSKLSLQSEAHSDDTVIASDDNCLQCATIKEESLLSAVDQKLVDVCLLSDDHSDSSNTMTSQCSQDQRNSGENSRRTNVCPIVKPACDFVRETKYVCGRRQPVWKNLPSSESATAPSVSDYKEHCNLPLMDRSKCTFASTRSTKNDFSMFSRANNEIMSARLNTLESSPCGTPATVANYSEPEMLQTTRSSKNGFAMFSSGKHETMPVPLNTLELSSWVNPAKVSENSELKMLPTICAGVNRIAFPRSTEGRGFSSKIMFSHLKDNATSENTSAVSSLAENGLPLLATGSSSNPLIIKIPEYNPYDHRAYNFGKQVHLPHECDSCCREKHRLRKQQKVCFRLYSTDLEDNQRCQPLNYVPAYSILKKGAIEDDDISFQKRQEFAQPLVNSTNFIEVKRKRY